MEFLETHTIYLDKIKKLKNNGLALSFDGSLVLHKDQNVIKILEEKIIDFDELDDGNIIILKKMSFWFDFKRWIITNFKNLKL